MSSFRWNTLIGDDIFVVRVVTFSLSTPRKEIPTAPTPLYRAGKCVVRCWTLVIIINVVAHILKFTPYSNEPLTLKRMYVFVFKYIHVLDSGNWSRAYMYWLYGWFDNAKKHSWRKYIYMLYLNLVSYGE